MKRLLSVAFLTILGMSSTALAAQVGIGVFGGMDIPVAQEDQGKGTVFGFKGKVSLLPGVVLEPNINFIRLGEVEFDSGTRPGSKITSIGLDALLGTGMGSPGLRMYGILGMGYYSISREHNEDASKLGWSAGLGFEVGFASNVGFDIRGKLDVFGSDGGGTKKSAAVMGGVNYYLGY